jgi:hypothetical protein
MASNAVSMASRAGYAAHGVVYALIAVFALDAALGGIGGGGGRARGGAEAISSLGQHVGGTIMLVALAAGLAGYALMRFWQGFARAAECDTDVQGLVARAGRVAVALVHVGLVLYTLNLAFGFFRGGGGGGESAKSLTARAMAYPGGAVLIAAIGIGFVAVGAWQLKHAISADFMDELDERARRGRWIEATGRVGFAARFVVFAIVGVFLVIAAIRSDPSQAEGLGGALGSLLEQPFGPWLLGAVALGLLAFAVTHGYIFARFTTDPHLG